MDYPIRNVTFGGFDRQDVVRYLENFSRSAEEEKQALREENDQLRGRTEELEGENASLRAQLEEARERADTLREELARETALREELEALRDLEGENARLRAESASLQRDAAAYARFRERVGSIECEARERADALEAGASEKMRRTMVQFQERYQELIRVIESTAGHVTGELRKVEVNLSQLPRAMDQADREFEDLSGQISRGEYVPDSLYGAAAPEEIVEPEEPKEPAEQPTEAVEPAAAGPTEDVELEEAVESAETAEPEEAVDAGESEEPEEAEDAEEPSGRNYSLRDAVIASAEAKAPALADRQAVRTVRTVRTAAPSREVRNNSGLFGFGPKRRPDARR